MDHTSIRFTWTYAISQLRLKYRFTALGVVWNLLEPLLYLGVLSLVFSYVNRMTLSDYAVFLFSALVPWRYSPLRCRGLKTSQSIPRVQSPVFAIPRLRRWFS